MSVEASKVLTYTQFEPSGFSRRVFVLVKSPTLSSRGFVALFEVLNSSFEHTDVVFAGDVLVQAIADTLAVTHLA